MKGTKGRKLEYRIDDKRALETDSLRADYGDYRSDSNRLFQSKERIPLINMSNNLKRAMNVWLSLLCFGIVAGSAYAQGNDTTLTVIPQGVQIVICFPDLTKKIDTLTIEQYIQSLPKDAEQRNRNLRQLNEQMKKPE